MRLLRSFASRVYSFAEGGGGEEEEVDSMTSYLVGRGRCMYSEPKKNHEYLSREVRDP